MKIYIPTRSRPDKQPTAKALIAAEVHKHYECVFVVGRGDTPPDILPHIVTEADGISNVRQAIMDMCDDNHVCMMDDDLRFYHRDCLGDVSLVAASNEHVLQGVHWLERSLREYAHVGISARTQNFQCTIRLQNADAWELETVRPYRVYGFDKSILVGEKLEFSINDEINVMDDFHITLSLLELGYPNLVNFRMAQEQGTSNSAGGASDYRDVEVLKRCAIALHKAHPKVVKVVEKTTKNSWGGTSENPVIRTDVICYWQRALGLRVNESLL